jgi:Tfp pilus assembly major pilin PilA
MFHPYSKQQGFTLISLVFILGIIGFFVMLVLKIGPIYLDHNKVKSALAALENTTDIETFSEPEVRSSLDKRFNMNYVSDLKAQEVKITKRGNYLKVQAKYEVVEKIAGNLSVLVEFDDVMEVGKEW